MSLVEKGIIRENYTTKGNIQSYQCELLHKGLNEHRVLKAKERDVLKTKIKVQLVNWEKKWDKVEESKAALKQKEKAIELSKKLTEQANKNIKKVDQILINSLNKDHKIDWDKLKDKKSFNEKKPEKPQIQPLKLEVSKPLEDNDKYKPRYTILDHLINSLKIKKDVECKKIYKIDVENWEALIKEINEENTIVEENNNKIMTLWRKQVQEWEKRKNEFYSNQEKHNNRILKFELNYEKKETDAIEFLIDYRLRHTDYPDCFELKYEFDYNAENKILIIEFQLPNKGRIPSLKEVRYIQTKKELREIYMTESQVNKLYDSTLYKIPLKVIYELFSTDENNVIEVIVFNGCVRFIDPATGHNNNTCILSVQVSKDEFTKINLKQVDSKACFKKLKGVGCANLSKLVAIKPIIEIDREDKRFIASKRLELEEGINLACMDWEDFEHLIGELFEQEFSANGGEVKVTRASKDGGVDAIAFDPDPIRGGKIVIQAKRYTNTVGVAAVRDLYGTLMNEGATKGILVTTANYGSDAYEFAKNKPITLLTGGNLLHLLEKHGKKYRINIQEAKEVLGHENR